MSLYEKLEVAQAGLDESKKDTKSTEIKRLGKLINRLQRKLSKKNRKSASQHRTLVKLHRTIEDQVDFQGKKL